MCYLFMLFRMMARRVLRILFSGSLLMIISSVNAHKKHSAEYEAVKYHNKYRAQVHPKASNMLMMSWHKTAAQQAQRYAEQCVFLQHSSPQTRTLPKLGGCGENIFVSSTKSSWKTVIKSWFDEKKNFAYGSPNNQLHDVGHYTQVVWANSHKVGCGVARCSGGTWGHFYNYICHYCPAGNHNIQYPYKIGKTCGDCPRHCKKSLCTKL